MTINARQKGKRIELEACSYLRALGFRSVQRGQQFRGGADSPDVKCADLPVIHFEIKGDESVRLGTQALVDALCQSYEECDVWQYPVVLWKNNRTGWRLTFLAYGPTVTVTVCGDRDIGAALRQLQEEAVNYYAHITSEGE